MWILMHFMKGVGFIIQIFVLQSASMYWLASLVAADQPPVKCVLELNKRQCIK